MKHLNLALSLAACAGLLSQFAIAKGADLAPALQGMNALENARLDKQKNHRTAQVKINCAYEPLMLKRALERKSWVDEKVKFVISGVCQGPVLIDRHGVEIVSDTGSPGSLRVAEANNDVSAILVQSGSARLVNFYVDVPAGMAAVKADANASVTIDGLTTNAKADAGVPLNQFMVSGSSSLFLTNLNTQDVLVTGASSAEFGSNNRNITLDVRDTSTARTSAQSHFTAVQVSANGYFLADYKSQVDALGIWGKASAEINRESTVGRLDMGGQTLFAAYRQSVATGPYGIYGNVVFELEHSTATNWQVVNNPHAMFIGNNSVVNGVLYPGWSWSGQGTQP